MKASTLISLAFLISLLSACASTSSRSILEDRAGYGVNAPPFGVGGTGDVRYVPTRIPEKVIVAWLHKHELPSKDYFWGAWLSVIVSPESWGMKEVTVPAGSTEKVKTQRRPTKKPPQKAKPINPTA